MFLIRLLVVGVLLSVNLFASSFSHDEHLMHKFKKRIKNSTWVVPPDTLLAYQFQNGAAAPVSDQTVWVITDFNEGYFFGDSYTSINRDPTSHKKLVGSITPSGHVYITFYVVSGDEVTTSVINGIGQFKMDGDEPYFLMQMNSAQNNLSGLSHWSYMLKVKPDDYFYQHLPGEDMSVPQFIEQFQ